MFTTLIVKPIFNLLVLIYAIIPGHNFGVALIIFTIIIRLLLWPLLKKQLHQAKAMRKLQPEIRRIKKETKGDRAKESQMLMELYKERGINPFAAFPTLILQFVVLIGLYSGLRKVINDPYQIIAFAYKPLQHLSWMEHLSKNIHMFDETLLGFVHLSQPALKDGNIYWPAMVIVLGSAIMQYFSSKQLLPQDKDQKGLREILRSANKGDQADQSEVNAAVGRSTRYFLPVMIFLFTVNLASALSLYWLTGGIVAFIQQSIALREDEEEMEAIADRPSKDVSSIPEAEIVASKPKTKTKKSTPKKKKKNRRKKK
ncbi:MAG TPA: YidC/Oxa1 family membrane protein insertase [Candidatus Sulfotelmatobacter sp.]|nr:YidC/Oxa1 family membrane protein insertase [Candidatus Sulfotelmatobacter sp.]